ncbi:MAG: hypothetical protein DMD33_09425 [Gemmatimonadetes bacterium]|nr:MAG: hypothetical protein DMD33_09425 [Gemmatimonadota bacterium]
MPGVIPSEVDHQHVSENRHEPEPISTESELDSLRCRLNACERRREGDARLLWSRYDAVAGAEVTDCSTEIVASLSLAFKELGRLDVHLPHLRDEIQADLGGTMERAKADYLLWQTRSASRFLDR